MIASQRPDSYNDPEFVHLINQLYANVKKHCHAMLDLQPGTRVLDVGSDVGDDTITFAKHEGVEVVGVESSQSLVAFADQQALEAGVSDHVQHVLIDDHTLPFEANSFDICHVDRMLQHLDNSKPIMAEMFRVLKPGGLMVIAESDQGTIAFDCSQQDTWWKLLQHRNTQFANPFAGRQLFRYANMLGLDDIKVQVFPVVITDYDLASYFVQLGELEDSLLEAGQLTEDELAAWRDDIDALEQESGGNGFASINLTIVRGYKPVA
jgi:SAM-dependent methyltransferase